MFVYVISGWRCLHKIGISADPGARVKLLQTGSPVLLSVAYSIEVRKEKARLIEQRAHILLRDYRAKGEWFRCDLAVAQRAIGVARAVVHGYADAKNLDIPFMRPQQDW